MTQREIAASTGCGKSTVGDVLKRYKEAGLTAETSAQLTDDELQAALYPKALQNHPSAPEPDWQAIHEELAKSKHLNLQFIWERYRTQYPNGLSYSRFSVHYRQYRKETERTVSLYQERKAGDIMEVDWMGDRLDCVIDGSTGETQTAHFFVSVLGHSLYPYVEAFPNEQEIHWITAHVNALHYYGGIPRQIVPDNCRVAVKTPKYYEPIINTAYWELAQYYEVAIVPTRVRSPQDKGAVEQGVRWLETWLLGKLKNQRFFSFPELNKAIRKELFILSNRPFQKREGSRYSEFIKIDKPALRPLPPHRFEIAEVRIKRVGDNYHLEYVGFHYSVPYTLHGQQVVLRATTTTVEVLDKRRVRVASHPRRYSASEGRYVTREEHMPLNHQAVYRQRQFYGQRYRNWAQKIGEHTYFVINAMLNNHKVEEQSYRACMGVLQFTQSYSGAQVEEACRRAREIGSCTYTTIKTLLKNGIEEPPAHHSKATPTHENIRGSAYYAQAAHNTDGKAL
jgi:transposase